MEGLIMTVKPRRPVGGLLGPEGSVSKVEIATPMDLIYKVLFPSISTFETSRACLLAKITYRKSQVTQKYEDGQANQAGCLNLLTNAVMVWNTVYMQAALDAIQHEGYPVQEEDLVHLWPIRFVHIHRYGKYEFNVEAARARVG